MLSSNRAQHAGPPQVLLPVLQVHEAGVPRAAVELRLWVAADAPVMGLAADVDLVKDLGYAPATQPLLTL